MAFWGATDPLPTLAWRFRAPEIGDRYGRWLWDGSVWQDGTTYGVQASIQATAGQTVYVRVSGYHSERFYNLAPMGVTVAWAVTP